MGVNGFERRIEALEQRQRDTLRHEHTMNLEALSTAELHTMKALIGKATPGGATLEIELLTEAERDTLAELVRKAKRETAEKGGQHREYREANRTARREACETHSALPGLRSWTEHHHHHLRGG